MPSRYYILLFSSALSLPWFVSYTTVPIPSNNNYPFIITKHSLNISLSFRKIGKSKSSCNMTHWINYQQSFLSYSVKKSFAFIPYIPSSSFFSYSFSDLSFAIKTLGSTTMFFMTLFCIMATHWAKLHVEMLSNKLLWSKHIVDTILVWQLPPKESFNTKVIKEFL